jgi:PAS domain S-box-containing protein
VIGWLRLYGERRAIFDSEAGVVLVALIYTVCLLCFLWLTARSANRTDRRRLTNAVALQESERRFVTTLASLGDAVIATEADGRITFLNRVAEELTGWSQHQAKGRSIQEVFKTIDEQTGQQAEDIAGRVLDEGLVIQLAEHMALVRRDGRVVPIEDSAAPIVDDTGQVNGVVLVFRDVTQSRLAQAALRESEAHFRALTEALPQIVWTADASGGVEWFSQHWYGYTGLAQEGGTDRSWQPVVHPEDLPDRLASWQRAQRLREAYEGEYRLLRADGEYRWFLGRAWPLYDTTGNIVRWIGTDTDIQDRKLAEAVLNRSRSELEKLVRERTAVLESVNRDLTRTLDELRATQAAVAAEQRRFREVLESLPVFVTLLTPNHEITFANRLFRERFGDPTGRCCFEFLLGLAAPCADCRATRVLKTMESYSEEWTGPDGRSYEIANFLHVDSDGTSLVMKVGIDITDRRRVEEELRSLNVKLEQRATQLRALTTELAQAEDRERRRLAEILHDHLQQLLVATRFNADTLYRTVNDESRRKIAGRMLEMLDQAIAASRTLTIELSPPVLQDSGLTAGLTWLAGWMESNHDFKVDVVAMTPVDDLADEQRLLFFQAVRELLFNAVKHSGVHHARVELETGSPDGVRVTVSDKGRGFAAEAQESAGSFGLLNIRERFAYFDGEMTIDSGIGKGTRVVLTAPARRVARLESNPPSAPTFRVLPTANP